MTSTQPAVLARIDELITHFVRQLVLQDAALQQPTPPLSLSSADSQASSSDRPAKRRRAAREAKPKVTPMRLLSFAQDGERKESNVSPLTSLKEINTGSRDIFYQCLQLFRTQAASDRIINQIVTLLGCAARAELNIVASPRGMIAGPLTLVPPRQEAIKCRAGQARFIPPEVGVGWRVDLQCTPECASARCAHLVLVVEKEAVFKTLLQHQALASNASSIDWGRVVIVTAKGYPDHATRTLLRLLSSSQCQFGREIRVLGLFDGDPYGVHIHHQFGVQWLGVDVEDFLPPNEGGALVQLRNDERTMAVRLLRTLPRDEVEKRTRLTTMLLTGYKVEIEAAYDVSSGLVGYVEHKLSELS
ncbi:Spo11/DNA topoisomerase VI, subunit A, N-terminal [Kalmanozyma brasiliensis GHG001]|uniref:Spo11/DNA topoisomerase VI, subunit A, N-terminal n=1 Tax=Kalmanozyma brasiliensis (strain GHG001) TaxID=1365824 RepID=UPI002867DDE4|nr:Spo11/DNA topoisomerase VI, subunit A, N-terminal [Kalmanozyma brasiliensis GHG001]EST08954.2 Spo11/DNA topoisomerase VI, subunit A, N-terminal [Kalmanozyma brasiliensis GHG001]